MKLLYAARASSIILLSSLASSVTGAPNSSYPLSVQMLDSMILRAPFTTLSFLDTGVFAKALRNTIEYSFASDECDKRNVYENFLQQLLGSVVGNLTDPTADTKQPLDRLSDGTALLYEYEKTGNQTYLPAITALAESVSLQPKNQYGGLWYYVYPNWSYLDGMFSYAPFYSLYTSLFSPFFTTQANAEIIQQLDLLWTHCIDNQTGLLHHGYDASRTAVWANPITGSSPWVWSRALGWYFAGLVDVLEVMTVSHQSSTWKHVLQRCQSLASAIVNARDSQTGAWWQIVTEIGMEGNYPESSGTALFVYALMKGRRLGYLRDAQTDACGNNRLASVNGSSTVTGLDRAVEEGYAWLTENAVVDNDNGTLGWNRTVAVCSLNSTASYEVCLRFINFDWARKKAAD